VIFINIPNYIQKGYKNFPDIHPTLSLHFYYICGHVFGSWDTTPNLLPFSWLSLGHELKARIMALNVFIIPFKNVYTITPFITFFRM
jgi:hypothetical protein